MIGITIREGDTIDTVKVYVWEGTITSGTANLIPPQCVGLDDLREFVEGWHPDEMWHDGELVRFCDRPGCNELMRADDPSGLCPGCLAEYQAEQRDEHDEMMQTRHAGVPV
jgi:hypothetical protein